MFYDEVKYLGYVITPRYGADLQSVLALRDFRLEDKSIYKLGMQLLDILEVIHAAGLVFNNLCLENIVLDHRVALPKSDSSKTDDCFIDVQLHLVNFANASKWRCANKGKHLS